jgi:hypothetical protein
MVPIQGHCDATILCLQVLESDEAQIVSNLFYTGRCLEHGQCGTTDGCE